MNRKISAILFLCLLIAGTAKAQNDGAGSTGLSFLKLGVGARSIAMGDAYSSLTDDATSVVYNPSRLLYGAKNNVILMHNSSGQDLNNDFLAAKISFDKVAFGIGIIKSSVDDIEVRSAPGASVEKFNAQNLSIGVSLAYRINPNISVGITSKFLYEKIYVDDASGVGFDFGTNYDKDNLSFSFVVANLGSVNELRNTSTKLPSLVRFGGGYRINKGNISVRLAADGFKVLDGGGLHVHTGGELGYNDLLFARVGYQTNYENKGLTAGVGVKYKSFSLDYAYTPYLNDFGTGNTFSLALNF
jgi:hypothetical protein